MACQGHEIDGQKKAGSGNLTSRLSGGCFPSGREVAKFFPFRPYFQIFRDVTNYPDLKQSRFGARINGKTGRREIPIVDSQNKPPDYQSIEYDLSLSNLPRNGRSNISFKGKMPPSPFLLTIAIGQGCLQKRKGQKTIYHYHDKFYV